MLELFAQNNRDLALFGGGDKIIVALSGGVDSMVLAELILQSGVACVFAHCNFHLRGKASDDDERFVCRYAEQKGVILYVQHFDTENYAAQNDLSIEMAARDLRYAWFEELRRQLAYDKIALAHHADDQIETFFINLLRGSGINGLKAMKPVNGRLIRPLLWASRARIEDYARRNGLQWCEDATNRESVYLRNKIRNELLPELDRLFPECRKAIGRSVSYLAAENGLYREMLHNRLTAITRLEKESQIIEKQYFDNENGRQLLFEWLYPYGFNTDQVGFVAQAMEGVCGKRFRSATHQLVVERSFLQLSPICEEKFDMLLIDSDLKAISAPVAIRFLKTEKTPDYVIDRSPEVALFDFDKLKFPLKLRKWEKSDRFCPLGMKGSKLLSDFFVNQGLTTHQKEQTFVLLNADETIVWVVGRRIDDRFKLDQGTKNVLECRLFD